MSCNASKGAKELQVWLESAYCKRKGIRVGSVAEVVRNALVVQASNPSFQLGTFDGHAPS